MRKPIVLMFSGQGSQYQNMGKELYRKHARFRLWMDHCNEILHPVLQGSMIDILYNKKYSGVFKQLRYTNPALLSIEYCLSRVFMEMQVRPDYLLGYSLGEITALVVSGVLTLEEGLLFLVDVAKLIERETPPINMLAILAPVEIMKQFPDTFKNCWLIGENFKNHFVVSCLSENVSHIEYDLNQKEIVFQVLPVHFGFHTELMNSIADAFKTRVNKLNLFHPRIPIFSATKAKIIQAANEKHIWTVFRCPIRFKDTIHSMTSEKDYIFVDAGPSGTLSTFVKHILSKGSHSITIEMMNQFGKNLESIKMVNQKIASIEDLHSNRLINQSKPDRL